MNLLENLNESQAQAVCHTNGPLLILAGPGSGKTRVITHRIAHLMEQGIPLNSILALTFTNKAAKEMAQRVTEITHVRAWWVSTFHSFCSRVLRQNAENLGYEQDFSIYDTDDQKKALTQVFQELDLDKSLGISKYGYIISQYKNKGIAAQEVPGTENYWNRLIAKVYQAYQKLLQRNNAMDFDDLLLKTLELFNNYSDVRESYQDKFQYILLDEFQDTNQPQYKIAKILAQTHRNICATGDPDQSIYSWRGANIENILNFEKDFDDAKVVKLEQNYRSTQTILKGAAAVIAQNKLRKPKALWTNNPMGEKIQFFRARDDQNEAQQVCLKISKLRAKYPLSSMVIFYRVNSQSRAMETALTRYNVPYTIVGAVEFYQRAEIKDILAYLRFLANPRDEVALMRIINVPARLISKVTQKQLLEIAWEKNLPICEILKDKNLLESFKKRPQQALQKFSDLAKELNEKKESLGLAQFVELVLQKSGYLEYIEKNDNKKEEERMENIQEFVASVYEYEKAYENATLSSLLEYIALIANTEKKIESQDYVTLMTLHAAKGLEFPVVFMLGMSKGLCPHSRSETEEEIEEERRLFFVGMTRAKKLLTLSYSQFTHRSNDYGYGYGNEPSGFLREIPKELIEGDSLESSRFENNSYTNGKYSQKFRR